MENMAQGQFNFNNQTAFYRGKVRDVYSIGHDRLLMVTSDRISAFDVILPRTIPFKGQVLNQIATYFLNKTRDIIPNWLIDTPDPNAAYGYKCIPIPIEMVVRGYVAGHLWREYKSGKREVCGVSLTEGLKENDRLPEPIITPTTKASEGHDEDISVAKILELGIVTPDIMNQLCQKALALFERGTQMAQEKGLILVDTKYEFGLLDGQIMLMDEIHTPDSSRYFYANTYQELLEKGLPQKQLSKEFVREWLIANGFQGKEGQVVPTITDEFVEEISNRYILLYEEITGQKFQKEPQDNLEQRIFNHVNQYLENVN
ncbi:phosphoribosylaminoimidazolesuccinocarboxamide synthase [Aquirufa ecclesiirivi]|uniref:phosphoribosylaminoimidazolesuccinocarboxamide synthase n=1 Tax=Aquirufa ecclesiirivi TaxID=2715124 RepID=UPI00140C8DB9|nr:phosphoribosylaminoimidazolesuccinocarboxamide synthase [Aquirufa ecclesiirivi]MCZ2472130.1 phosphoribosylaminoimidazolesuccinocarboxamide synthase [Aquirufa ecclesiirivi]NHC48516.1 phosphoribosylaminoimidazolesuccinocarboxamide synthase [Aquirufa ecclesiirivi]